MQNALLIQDTLLSPHLEDVSLAFTVDAGEGSINRPADAPHVLYELWITRKNSLFVQFKKVLP